MLLILHNSREIFVEDLHCNLPLISEIDYCKSIRQVGSFECKVFNNTLINKIKYLWDSFYFLFESIRIEDEYLNIFSLYNIKKKICGSVSVFLDKIMHQSCALLNSDVIVSTTEILELDSSKDRVYWVIQLGALRNSKKVFEIVDTLKMYNYLVYISPCDPTPGEIIRIFVGPSSSKEDLECLLADLYFLSGLSGKIRRLSNIHE